MHPITLAALAAVLLGYGYLAALAAQEPPAERRFKTLSPELLEQILIPPEGSDNLVLRDIDNAFFDADVDPFLLGAQGEQEVIVKVSTDSFDDSRQVRFFLDLDEDGRSDYFILYGDFECPGCRDESRQTTLF